MSKFFARFDSKAAKDTKAKRKANPPGYLSIGETEAILGKANSVAAGPTSVARGSPLEGKAPAIAGKQYGGEARQSKRQRVLQGNCLLFALFALVYFIFSCYINFGILVTVFSSEVEGGASPTSIPPTTNQT